MAVVKLDNSAKFGMHPQLFAALKGLAVDNARGKLAVAAVPDLTDSSTGTAGSAFTDSAIPSAAFDATVAGGADLTTTNAALLKFENASKVLNNSLNNARSRIGLPNMSAASGTQASPNVIPAQDLTVSTANGTAAVDYASAKSAMSTAKSNLGMLMAGLNELRAALGMGPVPQGAYRGDTNASRAMLDVATVTASATGASSVSKAVMDAFLASMANNLATFAKYWNLSFTQGAVFTALTDSSGGVAASGLVANPNPAPATGAATTSSPKAGFDAELVKIENAIAEIAAKMNLVRGYYDLPLYTDSTGQTANGTIEALTNALTAVDGSTGTVAVDQITALARMTTVKNALSSLAVGINDLVVYAGAPSLTDASGGTASMTLADIAATGTGVSGANATLLDTAVDAWLVINQNNIASLAATLNLVLAASQSATKPLGVVAG